MQRPEKTQRSKGPMLGYDHIELELEIREHRELSNQWQWRVWWIGLHFDGTNRTSDTWAMGLEGSEDDAWQAAALAREEIWELVR